MKYVLVQWPESQDLMMTEGFEEHSTLANVEFAGSAAYFVEEEWLNDKNKSTTNKVQELQTALNDAVRETFEQFVKSGKCYDFSLDQEVSEDEICEEHYGELMDEDEDEVVERIESNCPWSSDLLDCESAANRLCVGVMSHGDSAYATFYDEDSNEVFTKQIWGFNSDVASRVISLMSNQ